ncbi:MAG TPA: TonB-dependent receptor [Phenylobacterium sp.]|uniref:TonB-dependent receptor n=1 Tax=Phenylobacterium sp. TaxID=1871053 RepID=UPI002F94FFEC
MVSNLHRRAAVWASGVSVVAMSVAWGAQAQVRRFDVPAQAAQSGVQELGRQSGLQLLAAQEDLVGRRTAAVVGDFDAREGVQRGLKGSGLAVRSDSGRTLTLGVARSDGSVIGRVFDPASGEYMRNAIVRLTTSGGESRATTSGERGEFRLTEVPTGAAQVTVSFMGFADQTLKVDVASGATTNIEISLRRPADAEAVVVEDVIVTASVRDGDARAIMSQRESMDIKNSLSSESFGDIAEGNVGEFIKFMPGVDTEGEGDDTVRYVRLRGLPPEYTAVTVNGVSMAAADANAGSSTSRSFSFEQVSLSSIDSIEISKTTSADVDANAPAGTINLRTKRAFDRKGRRVVAQVSGFTHSDQWNDRATGPGEGDHDRRISPSGQFEYSNVFFDHRLGVVASVSQSNTYTEMEQAFYPRSYVPNAVSPDPMAMTTINAHMRGQEVSRFAASLTLDYRASDNLILSLSAIHNDAYLWSGQRTELFTTGARTYGVIGDAALDFTTQQPADKFGVSPQSNIISKRGRGQTFVPSFEFTGEHFSLDGNLSYSDSSSTYNPLGREGAIYNLVTAPSAAGNFSASRSGLMETDFQIVQTSGPDWADPASYKASSIVVTAQDGRYARTEMAGGALNLSFETHTPIAPITFKTGVKAKRAVYDFGNERVAHQYRYVGPLNVAQFMQANASATELNFNDMGLRYTSISGSDRLFMPSNYKIGQLLLSHPEQFEHVLSAADYYTAYVANERHFEEDTNAAYFMATSSVTDRLTLRAGLRWEETRTRAREVDPLSAEAVKGAGFAVSATTGRATTIDGIKYQYESRPRIDRKGKYDYFFPSASAKFAINDSTDLQIGYSRTIRRPEVNVLAGVWSVNDEALVVTAPNPGLEPEISDNISIRVAKYFEPVGLIAFNYYRNSVKGLFQTEELTADEFGYTGQEYAGYTFRTTRTVDGQSIKIEGYELEFNHALSYLPGALSGLTVRGSYTHTKPEVPIALSAENFATLALAYKHGPLSLNLNTAWTGEKLNSVSTGSFIEPRVSADLSGSLRLRQNWSLFFSLRNLLNAPTNIVLPGVETPNGFIPDHAGDYREYGRSATFGLRAVF